uniref:Uncharacterized protein n=1 Tax=Daphnia galeata TaxID=27404 RepID=A0A8J2REA2_9CRUS|nr:unnamed protein product [Daphnia galeata]
MIEFATGKNEERVAIIVSGYWNYVYKRLYWLMSKGCGRKFVANLEINQHWYIKWLRCLDRAETPTAMASLPSSYLRDAYKEHSESHYWSDKLP